jgi:hypothetical protein
MREVKTFAFHALLEDIHDNSKQIEKSLSDKRLTQAERSILKCWSYLRKCDYSAIYTTLEHLNTDYDAFVETQKNLVLAIAYNNDGRHLDAFRLLQSVLLELSSYKNIDKIYFLALYNFFICSFNLKNMVEMRICLGHMSTMALDARQTAYYLNCQFQYSWTNHEVEKAHELIEQLKKYKKYMSEAMSMAYAIGRFMFYFKFDEHDKCYAVLNEIKKVRSYYNQSNFIYMKTLLDHITKMTPIYAYARSFKDNMQLYHQLMVIKCLEEDQPQLALEYWLELQTINRFLFADQFKYNGSKDLFAVALSLHLEKLQRPELEKVIFANHEDAVYYLLSHSHQPVSVENIYAFVWNEQMPDKLAMTKLKKLISRARVKYAVEIIYRKGCYLLLKKNAA